MLEALCRLPFEPKEERQSKGPSAIKPFFLLKPQQRMWVSSTPCSPAKCACVGTPRSLPEDRLPSMPIRPASWQQMTLLANNVRGMRCLNSFGEPCLASDAKAKLLASASLRICLLGSWMVPSANRGSAKLTEQTSQRQRGGAVHVRHGAIALRHHMCRAHQRGCTLSPGKGGLELREEA